MPKVALIAIGIFLMAALFRLYGLNWDQNQHLHPDERFLTMVAESLSWPQSIREFLDTRTSPLNPHNRGYGFYVYGTFPLFLTKFVAEKLNLGDYVHLTLVGRQLSALVDLGTVILVFMIAREMASNMGIVKKKGEDCWVIGLLSMFLYAIMVLPIQLSHFFAVDTYLTFFTTFSFFLAVKLISFKPHRTPLYRELSIDAVMGCMFGLAFASKITAISITPIILILLIIKSLQVTKTQKRPDLINAAITLGIFTAVFACSAYITARIAQPYFFNSPHFFTATINQKVLDNWKQLKAFDEPNGWFPPSVQWITTKPYAYPLKNIIFWGLGLPLGIISLIAITYYTVQILYIAAKRKIYILLTTKYIILSLSLLWIIALFGYEGGQFAKPIRYYQPIYPFIAVVSGLFIFQNMRYIKEKLLIHAKLSLLVGLCIGLLLLIYPSSFLTIYSRSHTRVTASSWIYQHVPPGKTLANEYWDDPLPLYLPNGNPNVYKGSALPLYDPDTKDKWGKLVRELEKIDYIMLSSNRLYGSIMTVPSRYPIATKYYTSLFNGELGFVKIAEFTSRPNMPLPGIKLCLTPPFVRYGIVAKEKQECPLDGISFVDDYADEVFTVFDHPKVLIFQKVRSVDYNKVLNIPSLSS